MDVVAQLASGRETAWLRSGLPAAEVALQRSSIDAGAVDAAAARLERFRPWIAATFPETAAARGRIESPLQRLPHTAEIGTAVPGRLLAKRDDALPVSGSVKARGGVHEVLEYAESLALNAGLITPTDDYRRFAHPDIRALLAAHAIAVGSTGNLGLSIGIVGAALGLRTTVHMSHDASAWKKALLRSKGVDVVEHRTDYTAAVAAGRAAAEAAPSCHFVDDERSLSLFAGYAVAGRRVAEQLAAQHITVDAEHPLLAYLPCGIGGAPGGVAYGLKRQFGDAVRCYIVEPTQAPCLTLGVATGRHDDVAVTDIGLSGLTIADGLAVGRPSGFVGRAVGDLFDGFVTVDDEHLLRLRNALEREAGINVEPSAGAGLVGPAAVVAGEEYRAQAGLDDDRLARATHLVWLTGGGMVPEAEFERWRAAVAPL